MNISRISYERFIQIALPLGIDPYHQPIGDADQMRIVEQSAYAVEYIVNPTEEVLLNVAGRAPRAVKVMQADKITKAVALKAIAASEYALALLPKTWRKDPEIQQRAFEMHGLSALKRIKKTLAGDKVKEKMQADLIQIQAAMAQIDMAVDTCKPEISIKLDGCLQQLDVYFKTANEIPFSECYDPKEFMLAFDVVGWRDMRGRLTKFRSLPTCELVEVIKAMAAKWARLLVGKHMREVE